MPKQGNDHGTDRNRDGIHKITAKMFFNKDRFVMLQGDIFRERVTGFWSCTRSEVSGMS